MIHQRIVGILWSDLIIFHYVQNVGQNSTTSLDKKKIKTFFFDKFSQKMEKLSSY